MEEKLQDWAMYETDDEDVGTRLWQIRHSFPDGFESSQYSIAVIIEWKYAEEGLPDSDTLSRIHSFEDLLTDLDTEHGNGLLVHIIRGSGVSELCYYVRDYARFMTEFNNALTGHPKYPIQIEFMNDSAWEYRRSIVENFYE